MGEYLTHFLKKAYFDKIWREKSSCKLPRNKVNAEQPTLGKIMGKFSHFFSKWANFSPILRKKRRKKGENTTFSRNVLTIFPSVQHLS